MQGSVQPILSVYDSASRQLIIPVYQRNYDWKIPQCERLFDDLVTLHKEDKESHFFGAVVADTRNAFHWVIIDGQQRITTTSLLLLALAHALDAGEVESDDKNLSKSIKTSLLKSDAGTDTTKFKLKPVKNDAAAYQKLFSGQALIEDSNITRNYRYFRERLARGELSGDELWRAINGLQTMILTLGKDDDPQQIFESLNSTGLSLSEADKVRNLVLMDSTPEQQEYLYENYWNEIENYVDYKTDWFIRLYLTPHLRKAPRRNALYEAFKAFKKDKDIREVLSDMHESARYAHDVSHACTGVAAADRRLRKFNILQRDVAFPFLVPVVGEFRRGKITDTELTKIVEIVDSYVFRQFVCDIPTQSVGNTFASLFAEAMRIRGDSSLSEVVTYLLVRRTEGITRFPSDDEFKHDFRTRNMYKIRRQNRNYLYECLENLDSNDTRDIAGALEEQSVSVEHIMPQTLTPAWKRELGDDAEQIHEEWLNRIGNLTITGYNSMYSNRSYQEKRETENGFLDSPYSLNKVMKNSSTWGLEQLKERTDRLTEAALGYWPRPTTDFKPKIAPLPQEPLGEDTSFTGRHVVAFEYHDIRKSVSSWVEATFEIARLIYSEHPDSVRKYAETSRFWALAETSPAYFAEIAPGLHARVGGETNARVLGIRQLFDALDLDKEELIFTFRKNKDTKQEEAKDSRFIKITKLEPLIEELSTPGTVAEDANQLLADIATVAAELREGDENPLRELNINDISSFGFIESASANELLWSFEKFEEVDRLMPGMGMLSHLRNGTLLKIVQTISAIDDSK